MSYKEKLVYIYLHLNQKTLKLRKFFPGGIKNKISLQ